MELKEIEKILAEEGFKVTVNTIDLNGIKTPSLSVLIELDERPENQGLHLNVLFVPGVDEQLQGCHILQLFITMADTIEGSGEEKIETLTATLAEFNFNLPLGAFGIKDYNQMLFYKHMMMMPSKMNEETKATLIQSVWLISFLLNQCFPVIEGILDKEMA